jgi:hypothetical protein
MMSSSRRPLLVFLPEGGGRVPGRWGFLTPPVEDPTGDIISSSLNGFSLSILSGSGPPDLDIFEVRKSIFLKVNQPGGSKNVLQVAQKDLRG